MARIRSGAFGKNYQCSVCQEDPRRRMVWGCEQNTRMAVPTFEEECGHLVKRYWRCPIKFIPMSIIDFIRRYDHHKRYPAAPMPDFDDISMRWDFAVAYLETQINDCTIERMEKRGR